jgi:hypothetical protein
MTSCIASLIFSKYFAYISISRQQLIQGSQIQLRIKGLRNIKGYIAISPSPIHSYAGFGRKDSRSANEICQVAGVWQC